MENMVFEKKLLIPLETKKILPASEEVLKIKKRLLSELKDILSGKDSRKILIIGPCSADSSDTVLEYLENIKEINEKVKDKLFIIPRVFTNKPRTKGEGYLGMVHQPIIDGEPDLYNGILATRKLHINAVEKSKLICADEMLYPDNHRYFNDVLGYATIGARSVEDQYHRMVASGVDVPVGLKNPLSGNLDNLLNAIYTAQQKHDFIYRGWAVHTKGNPFAHAILRGYQDNNGNNFPNYNKEILENFIQKYKKADLCNPAIIIDCSHSNSDKDYLKQKDVVLNVLSLCKENQEFNLFIKGFMIESYLLDGKQDKPEKKGKSLTDGCLGWEKTEDLILNIYKLL